MRRDSRLGMAIGGILVVVLIAYAVVVPKTNKKKVTLDTTGTPTASAGDNSAGGGALSASTDNTGSASTTADTPAHTDNAEKPQIYADREGGSNEPAGNPNNGTRWAALLAADHIDGVGPSRITQTPGLPRETSPALSNISDSPRHSTVAASPTTRQSRLAATDHRVAEGETFSSIALTYYGDSRYANRIAKANPKIDPRRLRPGTVVHLPERTQSESSEAPAKTGAHGLVKVVPDSSKEYAVQSGDSLYKISMRLYGRGDRADEIYELNKQVIGSDSARLKIGMVLKLPQPPAASVSSR